MEEGPVWETYVIGIQKQNSGGNVNVLAVKYEGECGPQESIKSCKRKGDKNVGKYVLKLDSSG